jgi:hypothetical protein
MARRRSSADRAHLSADLPRAVVLAVLLAVILAFSWRDGAPLDGNLDMVGRTHSDIASVPNSIDDHRSGNPFLASLAGETPVASPQPQVLIPTAPPMRLLIPVLNVHPAVEGVGVDRRGVMKLPVNAWNAGWYKGGPVPGAPGDAVIEGHAGSPDQPMLFARLGTLKHGARIVVVLADGSRSLFLVVSMASIPLGSAPPGMGEPYGPPRLTLITCTGSYDASKYSYSKRLVVEASYAGPA